ncbi:thermonuclease family protein [Thiomicrorhabdus sediminis]|uniref:Thermonuclease family protein n=1 Tax=Thiomicrorhabdus sediminis TaxID=2580412 RepID=A0A4P9K7D7_9GAMM|nr:thermonuclease family protein [Thiomicrorhabdus sediminis]QCU90959.1 thermonuclease family protein [Thiomicrorhabdus sediminis]
MKRHAVKLFILLTLVLSQHAKAATEDSCRADKIDLWAKAEYALSGDTIVIQNKRVRLIGLYAPQKERKQKFHTPGEPLADQAQLHLNKLLANNDLQVGIQYDTTKVDNRYRQLVHLFFKDGTSVQQKMLESGFAINRTQYNNLKYADCYYQAEKTARQGEYQLWDLLAKNPERHFPLAESADLTKDDEGYRIIRGKIVKVDKSATNYILNMDTTGIRVAKKHWQNFDYKQLQSLLGQTIEVRGYTYLYKGSMYMMIEHPYAIDVLSPIGQFKR